jgi:hypothetical protein
LFSLAAIFCGIGLFKSYSRGAWLGTACGLAYQILKPEVRSQKSELKYNSCVLWLRENRITLSIILVSVFMLAFWQFRFSELRPAQRAFSAVNVNDFSWRNRVTAWKGAIHMMVDRPLIGFGWGEAESAYGKKYSPLDESAAIEMNDFFMIGISSGVPAIVCFLAYLALVYRKKSNGLGLSSSIFFTCRSASLVLLVGFWFDGGLFKLSCGPIFWMLVELFQLELPAPSTMLEETVGHRSLREIWLRYVAGILAALALLQTTMHIGLPFLPVSQNILALARKYLVPPKEIGDFDFLAADPVWQGKKLNILLDHVDLANYNRRLINWQLDHAIYRSYVLSPVITGGPDEQFNWRRPLWEEFYPRIRRESSLVDVAGIVARHLCERVTIAGIPNPPHDVPTIWRRQITDERGFEIAYVAALRSVGVPARLNSLQQAEFWWDKQWKVAPMPQVIK